MTTTEVIAITGLCINGAAIVWGAAKLSSSVEHLTTTMKEIKSIVMSVEDVVHNLVGRMWVVEDRLDIPHRRISDNPSTVNQ
jgi:hypothetical protein